MATKPAVAAALAALSGGFGGDVTDTTLTAYAVALDDVADELLASGVLRALREHTGNFRPTPPQLRAFCGARVEMPDATGIIARIQSLGEYNPHGWRYPRVDHVRDVLGVAAAEAYGAVGSHRLYSENETTRGIAERDFAEALHASVKDDPGNALPAGDGVERIGGMHPGLLARLQVDHPKLLT